MEDEILTDPLLSTFELSSLSSIPYILATLRSSSPMMGKSRAGPDGERALMSFTQPEWDETLFADSPMSWGWISRGFEENKAWGCFFRSKTKGAVGEGLAHLDTTGSKVGIGQ